jgi:hypothetical protein
MTEEPKPRSKRGCVIWGIVGFLFLLALLAIPGLVSAGRAGGERNASSSLKTLCSAEADFRANDRDDNGINDFWVGDVSRLYYLEARKEPIKLIELSVANADGVPKEPLESLHAKAGYLYAAMKTDEAGAPYDRGGGRNPEKFAFCAYPERYKPRAWYRQNVDTATLTFIVNEANIIYRKDTGAAPVTRWPKDPAAEGWIKLD